MARQQMKSDARRRRIKREKRKEKSGNSRRRSSRCPVVDSRAHNPGPHPGPRRRSHKSVVSRKRTAAAAAACADVCPTATTTQKYGEDTRHLFHVGNGILAGAKHGVVATVSSSSSPAFFGNPPSNTTYAPVVFGDNEQHRPSTE